MAKRMRYASQCDNEMPVEYARESNTKDIVCNYRHM